MGNGDDELHLVFKGFGHGNLANRCTADLLRDFLVSASTEKLDPSCVTGLTPPPFFINFSGPRP